MMPVDAVYDAYSNRDDVALVSALKALVHKLVRDVQTLGPAAVSLRLREYPDLAGIIKKTGDDASPTPAGELARLTGFISAYTDYVTKIVDSQAVDAAEAELSVNRDAPELVDLVRMIILKTAFAHSGSRATELFRGVARSANVSEGVVKYHVLKLAKLKMLEHLKLGPKAVAYRVSHLGEAILARRMKPYELALFLVDEAARDGGLQAAMRDEMQRTWVSKLPEDKVAALPTYIAPPVGAPSQTSSHVAITLGRAHQAYIKTVTVH